MSVTATYYIGDVYKRMAELPDGSVDLVVTSPPFLALRSYLAHDHPDKALEIGSEVTPADFLDTLLALTAEWGRLLTPTGSICVELGDTFSGSGGAGGDYNADGLRDGQGKFDGSARRKRAQFDDPIYAGRSAQGSSGRGWPLPKSLTGIPTLYAWSLAYGRNLLTGEESPAGQWRIRNVIVWARPNPPVGALGDKFRPATSYITVATRARDRWFDLDAVRGPGSPNTHARTANGVARPSSGKKAENPNNNHGSMMEVETTGAPPLDWHADDHPEDGDWLWKLPTAPYKGKVRSSHRVLCGPDDGGERTTSPGCPVHGDLPGQVPTARHGAHEASSPNLFDHTDHTDGRPAPELTHVGESNDESRGRADSSPPSTSASSLASGSQTASRRSTSFRRTDLAQSTSSAGTPSVETALRIGDKSVSPESSGLDHDTDENRTSEVESGGNPTNRTTHRTADTDTEPETSEACTCSFHKVEAEYTSHYATFPPALPKRLIEAMCPRQVCEQCGEPRRRITEPITPPTGSGFTRTRSDPRSRPSTATPEQKAGGNHTLGWTVCDCAEPTYRPGMVLDPFAGSGTTLAVATGLGRDAIGIDIDERNADLAMERVGPMFMEVAQ